MQRLRAIVFVLLALGAAVAGPAVAGDPGPAPLRALVVTGGHDFEPQFFPLFEAPQFRAGPSQEEPAISCVFQSHGGEPDPLATIAGPEGASFDVFVFYDMWQPIREEQKAALARAVLSGKGLVVLHHALANYQDWPEYRRMVGGRYYIAERVEGGTKIPPSTYQHDLDLRVKILDRDHYITSGLDDFDIHDEAYGGFYVDPAAHALLGVEHPKSGPVVGWTRPYGKGRVAAIQLGHGRDAYENANFRTLLARAIRWAARRTPEDLARKSILSGRDLSGWKAEGNARFAFEDGILVGRQGAGGAAGDLFTEASWGNFDCEVVWATDFPGNSGIWFRYVNPSKAYQADILEWKNPIAYSGSVYRPGKLFAALNEDPSIVSRDGWNAFRIVARGDRIAVWLNGRKVADFRDDLSERGRFGIQVHEGADFARMAIRVAELRVGSL
ncbi:MAG: ThuA domain-containing protein [Planctomycetota bacterium]